MGCYALGKIVSKALGKCNGGHDRWREERMDYAMAYPPGPPTQTHYVRPVARTVTFSGTNSVYMIPPEQPPSPPQQGQEPQPQPTPAPPQHEPDHHHPAQPQPQPQPEPPAPTQDAPPADQPRKPPKRGKNKKSARVRFGPEPPPQEDQQQQQPQPQQQGQEQPQHAQSFMNSNGHGAPGHGHVHGHGPVQAPPGYFRYTPSPLPRWEATPRRHEYFSGEYRYSYPTPVREGIYSLATDANGRLTTIFSEENPNACAIV